MKTSVAAAVAATLLAAASSASASQPAFGLQLTPLASFSTQSIGSTGAEIVVYDATTRRAFAINSSDNDLVAIDLADPANPSIVGKVSLNAYGAGLNSVAVHDGLVAVAVEASPKTNPGRVVFIDASTLAVAGAVSVGALPDMLTFTGDGDKVLVANEGEPNDLYTVDPVGSVSIIDLSAGIGAAVVNTAGFESFNDQKDALRAAGIRIYGYGNPTVAQDLEPEYITVEGRTAWVTLQEANAVAVVDIPTATVQAIVPLGRKDHSLPGQGLDPSDRDGPGTGGSSQPLVSVNPWPVSGLYMPDTIASYRVGGDTFLVTANEGDARVYPPANIPGGPAEGSIFNEETRVGTGSACDSNAGYKLDPAAFAASGCAFLRSEDSLGRLTVTRASGDVDGDGDYDQIHAFGARSFSIWTASGELVSDSGDEFEQFFKANYPQAFNASNGSGVTVDDRSDNKGPEPEGVAVGRVGPSFYAFVGLERIGGVMVYDVTDPRAPRFETYETTRFAFGDRGTEGVEFVPEEDSPNGKPLLLTGNETSRTVTVFQVERVRK